MGKKPTPEQVEWQKVARGRLVLVLDRLFDGNQTRLARALGVTQALVNIVVREVQPPTRNLIARLGAVERVNPHWAATGEGEPFLPDTHGTLPVSEVPLPGPPADHAALMTRKRFAVAAAFDRPSCYMWRLPAGHPATAVDAWRLLPGDLLLLETSLAVVEAPGGLHRKWCVLDGSCLGRAEPVYGLVAADEKRRLVFSDDRTRVRFRDPLHSNFAPRDNPSPKKPRDPNKPRLRRTGLKTMQELDRRAAERETDPWHQMPAFGMAHVLAVQLLMIRP
ncbi:hypothetical protein [Urbifossiella limnaea]|uniref:Uncharacterized protein n=1 Tax=Urbifossiella limnaea TaxID=2528023 RepID=A0A517XWB5_9BACT|nr:hypothetical protein [Urbifossiella limnaea]QDU21801.1 hypothetical protein ETAA1_37740 [Urbifossiella limnaea]